MKELDHPNIIKLVDRLNDPISFATYLVTQLCEVDLHVAIFYPLKYDVRRIFLQILDAIIYMHQKGIYYRDLKPSNILLTTIRNQVVKVADLGAATRKDLFDGNVVTTTEYAPPEIYDSKVAVKNAAIDAWSLGVILFNLVTRKIPWKEAPSEFKIIDTFQEKYGFSIQLTAFFRVVFTSSEKRPTVQEMINMFSRIKFFMA